MKGAARFDAIVIGAGVNGLSAAVLLAKAGRKTLVLEEGDAPGGMAAAREFAPGFRSAPLGLDAGWLPPSVAGALGVDPGPRLEPEVPLRVITPAGSLALPGDPSAAAAEIGRHSLRDASRWADFAGLIHKLAGFISLLYTLPPPDIDASTPGEILPLLGVASRLRRLGRRDMVELLRTVPMSVRELLDDWFESPLLKAGLAGCGVTGIRQGPRSGGTAYVLLHRQVGAPAGGFGLAGGGYWKNGPATLGEALMRLARSVGVEVRCAASVDRVSVVNERATGVVTRHGDEYEAPAVISTADPARTILQLVDPVWLDPDFMLAVRNIKFRGSASRISFALESGIQLRDVSPEARLDGILALSGSQDELERGADAGKYGTISPSPFITLRFPSARWPDFAPPGGQVVSAEVQWTPWRLREGLWTGEERRDLERRVVAAIEAIAPGFGSRVVAMETLTPPDLAERYGLTEGAPSHGELTLDQILFMRPVPALARYATPIAGLFLGGSGSHPGPGIPGAAGWLAARTVLRSKQNR